MSYEFYEHKRRDRLKWIIVFGAIFLLAVFVLAANTNGFTDTDPYGWFTDDETPAMDNKTDAEKPDPDGILLPDGSETEELESPIKIVNSDYMKMTAMSYSNPNTKDSGVKLVAETTPYNSNPGEYIWEVQWMNENSDWPMDRNVEDYIELDIQGNECYVSAIDSFAEPIYITVKAKNNIEAIATCTVHYAARFLVDQSLEAQDEVFFQERYMNSEGEYMVNPIYIGSQEELIQLYSNPLTFSTYMNDYYTISSEVTGEVIINLTGEFIDALEVAGILEDDDGTLFSLEHLITPADIINSLGAGKLIPTRYSDEVDIEKINKFNEVIEYFGGQIAFIIQVNLNTNYTSSSNCYYIIFDNSFVEYFPITTELNTYTIIL